MTVLADTQQIISRLKNRPKTLKMTPRYDLGETVGNSIYAAFKKYLASIDGHSLLARRLYPWQIILLRSEPELNCTSQFTRKKCIHNISGIYAGDVEPHRPTIVSMTTERAKMLKLLKTNLSLEVETNNISTKLKKQKTQFISNLSYPIYGLLRALHSTRYLRLLYHTIFINF